MSSLKFNQTFTRFPEYADAIIAIKPNAAFGIEMNDYTSLQWNSDENDGNPPPTEDEIRAKLLELHEDWKAEQYKRLRYNEYPTNEEQLALLYDDMAAGRIPGAETSQWFAKIKATKDKYPTGSQPLGAPTNVLDGPTDVTGDASGVDPENNNTGTPLI